MPLRKSTASTATRIRICGVIWIITQLSRHARNRLVQSGTPPFTATRIRPRADSHSTTHSAGPTAAAGPNSSRKFGLSETTGAAPVILFFNRV